MRQPTFIKGVIVAFVFAIVGATAFTGLKFVVLPSVSLKLVVATLAAVYVLYLIGASDEKTGRLATPTLWLAGAVAVWLLIPGLTLYCIAHLGMVWLIRSLYFHTSVLPALLDLGLCAFGWLAAIATAEHSHSIFLTVWSFFLIQALFVAIPPLIRTRPSESVDNHEFRFNRALHTAEAAVRRMHTTN